MLRTIAIVLPASLTLAMGGCRSGQVGATTTPVGMPSGERAAAFSDPVAVSQLRERAVDEVAKLAAAPLPELRANALEAMLLTPSRLEALIPAALADENAGVRSTALMMIGKARMARLSAAARPLLNDPSPFARAAAIYALARTDQDIDRSPMATMLLGDPSPRVRAHVAYLTGEMGDTSALGLLSDASRATIPRASGAEMRMMEVQIAEAMVKLGDRDQIETIRAALYPTRPEDLEITALAVQVIGDLEDTSSSSELIYLTATKDRQGNRMPAEIRLGAAASMAKLGNTRGSFIADEFLADPIPALRAQAAHVYGETRRRENLAKLERLLSDEEGRVRIAAAAAILKVTSSGSAPSRLGRGSK
jgi:HEAT repeat protein